MQAQIRVGDTLEFTTSLTDYPASAGWVLTYRLVPRASGTAITIVGTASGDDHRTSAAASTTALWTAGEYSWAGYVDKAGEHYVVDSGTVTLLPNMATATSYDSRSPARQALDAINAALATYAEKAHVVEYEIGGRRMKFASQGELLVARQRLAAEVAAEDIQAKLNAGLGGGRKLQIRL